MASGKTEEEGLENPFKDATETTDVLVKVQDETLHLHSFLLAFYSPVLREAFESREQQLETGDVRSIEITIDSYSAEDVVIFFMFFYPEYKQKIVHDQFPIKHFRIIRNLLALSKRYQINWMRSEIDSLCCTAAYESMLRQQLKGAVPYSRLKDDSLHSDEDESIISLELNRDRRTIEEEFLLFCQEYQLTKIVEKLVRNGNFLFFSFEEMLESTQLKEETKFLIVVAKTSTQPMTKITTYGKSKPLSAPQTPREETVVANILNQIGKIITTKDDTNSDYGIICTKQEDCDVVVTVEDGELYLHSDIISHCSPVFKKLLLEKEETSTGVKEIILKDKNAASVATLFAFCYSNHPLKLKEFTNYDEMISLCREYQMCWLIDIVEAYLVNTKRFLANPQTQLAGLRLADKFHLASLSENILSVIRHVQHLKNEEGFDDLSKWMKYKLARKSISENWDVHNRSGKPDERVVVLNFLDGYLERNLYIK